ncbi:benzoate/H(+) symporter BenE family transporter [Egicoccus sp. AB-alg2]|uniref:benzoate/H(+) symporter BenE family transporter n=1 Tax=Egicoccus sp. AB-alg2 TaxID=3242693 RepID=UPI00359D214F
MSGSGTSPEGTTVPIGTHALVNGAVAWLFAVTGPIAVLLSVAATTGLERDVVNSLVLATHVIGGALSVWFSLRVRQPLGLAWTIPGAALLVPALAHLAFAEAVGAFLATGALLVVLGTTGWARRLMSFVPLPLVMAMVAAIFLPFALDVVGAFGRTPLLAAAMTGTFLVATAVVAARGRGLPPVLLALVAGLVTVGLTAPSLLRGGPGLVLAQPVLVRPVFSARAMLELVVPLTITVVAIQNAQGFAILRTAGYEPPEDRLTTACGVGSLLGAPFGAVSTCVTGPVNGILNASGPPESRWAGGVVFGTLLVVFGLAAPMATDLALRLPGTFIAVLGGLALLPVLTASFQQAFSGARWRLGAFTTFVVTLSDVTLLRVGSAFWGLVFGLAVSWLTEREDVRALLAERR